MQDTHTQPTAHRSATCSLSTATGSIRARGKEKYFYPLILWIKPGLPPMKPKQCFEEKQLRLHSQPLGHTSFFLKRANPGLFFIYFCLFKQTLQFLQQINMKKCPSSVWYWDSNSQPLEHESPPITTRPRLQVHKFGASLRYLGNN